MGTGVGEGRRYECETDRAYWRGVARYTPPPKAIWIVNRVCSSKARLPELQASLTWCRQGPYSAGHGNGHRVLLALGLFR